MTFFKATSMIFWKEYQQQKSLALALFIVAVGFHIFTVVAYMLTAWEMNRPIEVYPGIFYMIALVFSAAYTTCSASMSYSNEQEERTFSLLRNLPISRGQLLLGKTGWCLCSALAFLILNLLVVLPMVYFFSRGLLPADFWHVNHWGPFLNAAYSWHDFFRFLWIVTLLVCGHVFGCIAVPFCWGLFWSTRLRSVMNTILAALGSVFVLWMITFGFMGVATLFCEEILRTSRETSQTVSSVVFFLIFGGCTFFIGAVGLFLAYYWFDIWKDRKTLFADWRPPVEDNKKIRKAEYAMAKDIGNQKKGEFRTLFFHAIRQSKGLFLAMFGLGAITCLVMLVFFAEATMSKNYVMGFGTVLVGLDIFFLYIFAGNIFTADQKTQAAFLGDRGVSPGKIWWSRVLAFGTAYYVTIAAVFVCMCLSILIYNYSSIEVYNSISGHWDRVYGKYDNAYHVEWIPLFLIYTIPPFFAGVFASMFARSGIVATSCTMGLSALMIGWGALTQNYLGTFTFWNARILFPGLWDYTALWWLNFTALWCILPIVIGWLVASRLRTADWLRGRNIWKSRAVLAWIVLPFLAICVAIPFYRVYTIPKLDNGYRFDNLVYSKDFRYEPLEGDTLNATNKDFISSSRDLETLISRYEIVKNSYTDPRRGNIAANHPYVENEVIQRLDTLFPDSEVLQKDGDVVLLRRSDGTITEARETGEFIPAIVVDDAIEFLKKIQWLEVPYSERVKRVYEYNIHALKTNKIDTRIFRFCPWEKSRLLRQYEYEFQLSSRAAEHVDNLEPKFRGGGDEGEIEKFLKESRFYEPYADDIKYLYSFDGTLEKESRMIEFIKSNATGFWLDRWISHISMIGTDSVQVRAMYLQKTRLWIKLMLRLFEMKKQQESAVSEPEPEVPASASEAELEPDDPFLPETEENE